MNDGARYDLPSLWKLQESGPRGCHWIGGGCHVLQRLKRRAQALTREFKTLT